MEGTLDDYRWLTSDEARGWLDRTDRVMDDQLTELKRLRRHLSAARAALIVETWQLRDRARDKFSLAERMFFTRRALQQATDEPLAHYKSNRFPQGQRVWDLCCGVGGDLLGLARRGPVVAVDSDPVMILLAAANQRACEAEFLDSAQSASRQAYGASRWNAVEFRETDARAIGWDPADGVHIDPDRRTEGRRVASRVADYEPGETYLESLLKHPGGVAMKLAPAAETPFGWANQIEREWISTRGECRQQMVWTGILRKDGVERRATRLGARGEELGEFVAEGKIPQGDIEEVALRAGETGAYVYDPDPSLLASQLLDEFAVRHGLRRVQTGIAYLTSDHWVDHSLISGFRVLERIPFDRRRVKRLLESHGIGRLEVKKRGVNVDPAELVRLNHGAKSERSATLILSPAAKGVIAILAERERQEGSR